MTTDVRLEEDLAVGEGEIKFRVLSGSGDDRLAWDRRFLDQIHDARRKFYELLDQGYKAFRVLASGVRSEELMLRFDPAAEEIIFVPPVVGG